ncbi:unnamed protein product [Lactuca virosa]|uniref:Uncharacterized protein n=1 Tax=Lactuca virosa TaxID=75947 RepID=A0AAU9MRN7_9ASTR|nr:unnamed protein product [Lactuca virosa]
MDSMFQNASMVHVASKAGVGEVQYHVTLTTGVSGGFVFNGGEEKNTTGRWRLVVVGNSNNEPSVRQHEWWRNRRRGEEGGDFHWKQQQRHPAGVFLPIVRCHGV